MELFEVEYVKREYLGVCYTQQIVNLNEEFCKNFCSDIPFVHIFFPSDNRISGEEVEKEIEQMVASARLLEKAIGQGIDQEEAEAAIFPGCRKFYKGPKWLINEARKLR